MPLFSQAELDELCRSPVDRVLTALQASGPQAAKETYRWVEDVIRRTAGLYPLWSAATTAWLQQRHGLAGSAAAFRTAELLPGGGVSALTAGETVIVRAVLSGPGNASARAVEALIDDGRAAPLRLEIDGVLGAIHRAADLGRDAVTALLSHVYRADGNAGLDDCLRWAAETVWAPRMAADLAMDPRERLLNWAATMSVGHDGSVRIRESDAAWEFTLDPCGSCGRQVRDGRFAPPWDLAVVQEASPTSFLRRDITVYQAHLAVIHTLVPIEAHGAPWPAISCSGTSGGPCLLVLYKGDQWTDDRFYEQVGTRRPRP